MRSGASTRTTNRPCRAPTIIGYIHEAQAAGARLNPICEIVGISKRTLHNWYRAGEVQPDKRSDAIRPTPHNKLSNAEEQKIIETCLSSEFIDTSAAFVVNTLLDRGAYLASESTVNRIMTKRELNAKRGLKREHIKHNEPDTFTAKKPGQVLTWDITYLPSQDKAILAKRKQVVLAAKATHPERWAQDKIRDFVPVLPTSLNPRKLTSAAEIKIAA